MIDLVRVSRFQSGTAWKEDKTQSLNEIILRQGLSPPAANRDLLDHLKVARIAKRHDRTINQVVFRFALDVGMIPLTGTTDAAHMREDLDVFNFHLESEEGKRIEALV